jgi:hypothetical protein
VAIAHNAKAFDSQFILKRAILLKWNSQIILSGLKIISMKMQHLHFLDSISYLPMPLRKLPEAFELSSSKSWYPHYFNTKANLDYVGPIPDIGYFGADELEGKDFMSVSRAERQSLITVACWNSIAKMTSPICDRRVIFRREFMGIGNIEVFVEALTIASACNKVL